MWEFHAKHSWSCSWECGTAQLFKKADGMRDAVPLKVHRDSQRLTRTLICPPRPRWLERFSESLLALKQLQHQAICQMMQSAWHCHACWPTPVRDGSLEALQHSVAAWRRQHRFQKLHLHCAGPLLKTLMSAEGPSKVSVSLVLLIAAAPADHFCMVQAACFPVPAASTTPCSTSEERSALLTFLGRQLAGGQAALAAEAADRRFGTAEGSADAAR